MRVHRGCLFGLVSGVLFVFLIGCSRQPSNEVCVDRLLAGSYEKNADGDIPELIALIDRRETDKLIDVLMGNRDYAVRSTIARYFVSLDDPSALAMFRSKRKEIASVQGEYYVAATLIKAGDRPELWTLLTIYQRLESSMHNSTSDVELVGFIQAESGLRGFLNEVTGMYFASSSEFEAWLARNVPRPSKEAAERG